MVSLRGFSNSESPQVYRTFLSILVDLNYDIVFIFSIYPLISKCPNSFNYPLGIVPSVTITIGITVTLMSHSFFFSSLARSIYLSLFSLSSTFTLWSTGMSKTTNRQVLFLLTITRSDHLADIKWFICISKSQTNLCVSFSLTDSKLYIYHLFVWSNLNSIRTMWGSGRNTCYKNKNDVGI